MKIFVLTPTGRTISLEVEPSWTVYAVLLAIQNGGAGYPGLYTLLFAGKAIGPKRPRCGCDPANWHRTLEDFGIQLESTLHMVGRLASAMCEVCAEAQKHVTIVGVTGKWARLINGDYEEVCANFGGHPIYKRVLQQPPSPSGSIPPDEERSSWREEKVKLGWRAKFGVWGVYGSTSDGTLAMLPDQTDLFSTRRSWEVIDATGEYEEQPAMKVTLTGEAKGTAAGGSKVAVAAPKASPASTGGIKPKIEAIREALSIETPAAKMLEVIREANTLMGTPATSTVPGQVDALMAALGL